MPQYDLDRLGDQEFENLVQSLLKNVIGRGTITFGEGPDGGREATFHGRAPYPSVSEGWNGDWIFQAKFHNTRLIGVEKSRKQILIDLKSELEKITVKYKRRCDNYILATNVPLSSVPGTGTHDRISTEIAAPYSDKIANIHVWGYDDIARFLDGIPGIRQSYLHFITPGDLIAELMDRKKVRKSSLAEAVLLYVKTSFDREQYAQLDQAGEIGEKPMPLRKVFIDLEVRLRAESDLQSIIETTPDIIHRLHRLHSRENVSAIETLIQSDIRRTVLIGGPGQGKSTLGQFVAQIHRAHILHKASEINSDKYVPTKTRLPIRVILKDYAQWIVDTPPSHSLERFIAGLIEERASRPINSEQVQDIIKDNPSLVILDGLDEVIDRDLRTRMLDLLGEFIGRCEDVLKSDLQIIATSRPTGYSDQFEPSSFLHLTLTAMNNPRVMEYTERWITAKSLESAKGNFLRASIKDCLGDPHFSPLMNTPLQVTIFILIILSGGTPPRQREELFDEYLEVIYKRERAKSKTIIQTEKRLLFGLHQYLGYLLHKRAAGSSDTRSRMKEEEFRREVINYLRHEDPYSSPEELKGIASQMISEARKRLVLLVEFDDGSFGFDLRSIQEFFAAGWLTDRAAGDKQRFDRFRAIALSPHWRNVALFFAGRIGRSFPGEAAFILEGCREIDRYNPDFYIHRGAWLALEIAVDRSFGPNRVLQRSAIEFAFTCLDGDIERARLQEFTSRLRKLSKEDCDAHLMPLLRSNISKISLPGKLHVMEVFSALGGEEALLERVMSSAIKHGEMGLHEGISKSIEFGLAPDFIRLHFGHYAAQMNREAVENVLLTRFVNDQEYVTNLAKSLGLSEQWAHFLFRSGLSYIYLDPATIGRPEDFSLPSGPMEEVTLAFKVITIIRSYVDTLSFEVSTFRRLRLRYADTFAPRWTQVRSEDIVTGYSMLMSISEEMLNASALFELKAVILALLARASFLRRESGGLRILFHRTSSGHTLQELELLEMISFRLRTPSLDHWLLAEDPSTIPTLEDWDVSMRKIIGDADLLGILLVLDSLNASEALQVLNPQLIPRAIRKRFSVDLLRVSVRILVPEGAVPDGKIPISFVAHSLVIISAIIRSDEDRLWRAWSALGRLVALKWNKQPWAMLKRMIDLEKGVEGLCSALSEKTGLVNGGEVGCLALRLTEMKGFDQLVASLLKIISTWNGLQPIERTSRSYLRSALEIVDIDNLAKFALSSADEGVIEGFLKWFALVYEIIYDEPPYKKAPPRVIEINSHSLLHRVRISAGDVRRGALLLLAQSRHVSLGDLKSILDASVNDKGRVEYAWATLLRSAASNADGQEVIDVLELIISSGDRYPKMLRYAALDRYQRTARGANIVGRETELGLPFQDILEAVS